MSTNSQFSLKSHFIVHWAMEMVAQLDWLMSRVALLASHVLMEASGHTQTLGMFGEIA
jgi:hypothetical protein